MFWVVLNGLPCGDGFQMDQGCIPLSLGEIDRDLFFKEDAIGRPFIGVD